jgi:uncharacterized RDD family membrane protein YckC
MEPTSLSIESPTGVDVSLPVAGIGARSYAFIIDLHIRVLVALAWVVGASYLVQGGLALEDARHPPMAYLLFVVLPASIIYFLYHPLLETLLRGSTPGKRYAGLRIATRSGAQPSPGAILLRNAFRLVDALPGVYILGIACCMLTRDSVRVGDLAAGTVLIWNREESVATLDRLAAAKEGDAAALDLVNDLIGRWDGLDAGRRAEFARALLARLEPAPSLVPLEHLSDGDLRRRLEQLFQGARG